MTSKDAIRLAVNAVQSKQKGVSEPMKPERTKEEILQPLIWMDNNGHPNISVLDAMLAMEEYRSQSSPVKSKWVSVKERLPEEGIEVLVWSDRYGRTFATLVGKNGYGHFWKYAGDPIVTFNAPTHWQPLPELPPIEETKEK